MPADAYVCYGMAPAQKCRPFAARPTCAVWRTAAHQEAGAGKKTLNNWHALLCSCVRWHAPPGKGPCSTRSLKPAKTSPDKAGAACWQPGTRQATLLHFVCRPCPVATQLLAFPTTNLKSVSLVLATIHIDCTLSAHVCYGPRHEIDLWVVTLWLALVCCLNICGCACADLGWAHLPAEWVCFEASRNNSP